MATPELTLVLSGHLRRPNSADLRPFWQGFIELQKRLPKNKPVRQIVAHSWNPELGTLADFVYKPIAQTHEHQKLFYPEFLNLIEPPDLFERGLDRSKSTWKNVSIQSILGNVKSRAWAVKLLDKMPSSGGQVLITRWDLGQTGSKQVNQLVADASLPENYLYLSYFSEVDEGYADMWILAPWADACQFSSLDIFVLDALAGKNNYLEFFLRRGWPRARVKTHFEELLSFPVWHHFRKLTTKLIQELQHRIEKGSVLQKRIARFLIKIAHRFLLRPPITAENSCVPGHEVYSPIYPSFQALNIHALLKYFILSAGLRDRVRFLTNEDFNIVAQSGQLINPQAIVLFLHNTKAGQIETLLNQSPLPLDAVYVMDSQVVYQYIFDDQKGWSSIELCTAGDSPRDLMIFAFEAEYRRNQKPMPVLVMPSIERYLGCSDWSYMNALVKYIAWSQIDYVGFETSRPGRQYLDFPGLQLVKNAGAFSLNLAAGTLGGIRTFLDIADPDLKEISKRADRMQLEFPVVVNEVTLF